MYVRLAAVVTVASLAPALHASPITDTYTSYYAFGDSLSDDGKLGILGAPVPFPSFGGRLTNGPVWAEHVADIFSAAGLDAANLAFSGATAGDVAEPDFILSTFGRQIATFANTLATGEEIIGWPFYSTPHDPGSNPLVSVWFGANDIFNAFNTGGNPIDAAVNAANAVAGGVMAIAGIAGQSFDNFIIANLPDLGRIPAFALFQPAAAPVATAATLAFNATLANNIDLLRLSGLNIIDFDTFSAVNALLDDLAGGGYLPTIVPCINAFTLGADASALACAPDAFGPDAAETLLFSDGVHPNAMGHRTLADISVATLEATLAPVPLPASAPLILAALAGLGLMRLRRKAA